MLFADQVDEKTLGLIDGRQEILPCVKSRVALTIQYILNSKGVQSFIHHWFYSNLSSRTL